MGRILSYPEYKLVTRLYILSYSPTNIKEIFNTLNDKGSQISYWSVTYSQAAYLLCEAFQKKFTWPRYVYIIHDSIDQILRTETSCSKEEIFAAMEGVFNLDYRLYVENDTELVSGVNYSEFQRLYMDKLNGFANITNETLRKNLYANSLYDQVWSFTLAINKILQSVEIQNLSFEDYGIGKKSVNINKYSQE